MSHGGGDGETCEPNMTPLLDLVLQILMFFIVTINFTTAEDAGNVRHNASSASVSQRRTGIPQLRVMFVSPEVTKRRILPSFFQRRNIQSCWVIQRSRRGAIGLIGFVLATIQIVGEKVLIGWRRVPAGRKRAAPGPTSDYRLLPIDYRLWTKT